MINLISKTAGSSQSKVSLVELAITVHSDSWKQELFSVDQSVKAHWVLHENCKKNKRFGIVHCFWPETWPGWSCMCSNPHRPIIFCGCSTFLFERRPIIITKFTFCEDIVSGVKPLSWCKGLVILVPRYPPLIYCNSMDYVFLFVVVAHLLMVTYTNWSTN